MNKQHYVKTVEDIKYCEENGLKIAAGDSNYYEFIDGVWCLFCRDRRLLEYNACVCITAYTFYEEPEEQTDVGKLCWFWDEDEDDKQVSVLNEIRLGSFPYYSRNLGVYINCRPLTKAEIQEFMEKVE